VSVPFLRCVNYDLRNLGMVWYNENDADGDRREANSPDCKNSTFGPTNTRMVLHLVEWTIGEKGGVGLVIAAAHQIQKSQHHH